MIPIHNLQDASDISLIVSVARRHEEALAEIYRRHSAAVFALARSVVPDRASAEDIVRKVFVRVWNAPDQFDPDRGSLRSYLLAQCHGGSAAAMPTKTGRNARPLRADRATPGARDDAAHEVREIALAETVRSALDALPRAGRDAIMLAYFGGHNYRRVAELLGTSEGTVKSDLRSGLTRLRDDLSGMGIGGT